MTISKVPTSKCSFSQAATLQRLGFLRRRRLQRGRGFGLDGLGARALRLDNARDRTLRLGHTWEVAACKIEHLEKCPWEVATCKNAFGNVPKILFTAIPS